jgi:hypothetical protein
VSAKLILIDYNFLFYSNNLVVLAPVDAVVVLPVDAVVVLPVDAVEFAVTAGVVAAGVVAAGVVASAVVDPIKSKSK